jgi:cytochrome subunit of sulfide dehydrogenase
MKSRRIVSVFGGLALAAGTALAQQAAPPAPSFAPSNLSEAGARALAANCAPCHGTNGRAAPNSTIEGLAGVPRDTLVGAMTRFKEGKKASTVMQQIAKGYTDAEIAAIADYFSKQPR